MFEQFVKHVESYYVKLLIEFPCLIHGIFSVQNNDIVRNGDEDGVALVF